MRDDEYYWEDERMVFTERFHERRGKCCGSACRHCPYGHRDVPAERRAEVTPPRPYFAQGIATDEGEAPS